MHRPTRRAVLGTAALAAIGLAGCSNSARSEEPAGTSGSGSGKGSWPVQIDHAFGQTVIESEPQRVATVNWGNHEVPLALGIVPVGMAKTMWGDDDGDGIHPWVADKLAELGGDQPALFDETDGIDFEAVANTTPDVILAAYSGLTQEDYDLLTEIAPTVAYPEAAWATPWREMIEYNSKGLGLAEEGTQYIADLEDTIAQAVEAAPQIKGATAMMVTHVDVTDLSEISFYTAHDTRTKYFEDLGMKIPASLQKLSADTESFSGSISAERADVFSDVDIFVTYGGQELTDALKADPLLSQLPAVANDAIVYLPGDEPLGTAANPTPLQIPALIDDYVALLAEAVDAAAADAGK